MTRESPIGFLDSGVGGLTITSEVVKRLPGENIIYYGDNLHIPYGSKPQLEVREYVLTIIEYLVCEKKAKYVVIACNTATVAAIDTVRERFDVPVIGPVEEGAKKAVNSSKNQKIGLIAAEGTVKSGGYQNAIHKLNPDAEVVAVPAPKLVPLVESGKLYGPETEKVLREYLTPILNAGCDSIILGCTHYPFLTESIEKVSDGQLKIIFPGTEIARKIENDLKAKNLLNTAEKGEEICLTSQLDKVSKEFLQIGRKKLGMKLEFKELNLF
ncbi:glutamate racemase [Anoxybacter fermentans]|uniref:Glutamate racemase n=1 Tax=Anoxybacter fermentans TaxID=1323375 RepID=A0A3Q9HR25_9FIRM|nr:glutamate racemase [Anoxybacter fermentans]AZR73400.1 glutamate racemase [Anoxybacter fermentans]